MAGSQHNIFTLSQRARVHTSAEANSRQPRSLTPVFPSMGVHKGNTLNPFLFSIKILFNSVMNIHAVSSLPDKNQKRQKK